MLIILGLIATTGMAGFVGLMAWQWKALTERSEQLEQLVAVSWGDGRYGPAAFYGAYVYFEPRPDSMLDVKLSVRIGRSSPQMSYEHDPRTLGVAKDPKDAVARWGTISWNEAGLNVGTGSDAYLFPRAELERHR